MKKTILIFSILSISLLVLFKLSKYQLIKGDLAIEIILACIAVLFFGIGVILNKKVSNRNSEKALLKIDHQKIKELGISKREYEVLQAIESGLSNKEIADTLFVSESTIKSHVSSLLIKLDAKRRTQAIQIAKKLCIL
ncbi:response regulator transcription factor [Aquimarina pacifica]|uniref:response regulator transcription factor n=1 Tax=Aquimarina pacifica TaxID=1296415 RepID=UPI0004714A6A|nr:LuxR C-terminal-related transcriptional regulator [Aquimarina pacifica]